MTQRFGRWGIDMLVTHGGNKGKRFDLIFQDNCLRITNENGRQEEYPLDEILDIVKWLTEKFGLSWFPLANNVEKFWHKEEVDGLGNAVLRQRPGNISHAQGASYLGVVLEHVGILEWNGKQRGIQWRVIRPALNSDELKRAFRTKVT